MKKINSFACLLLIAATAVFSTSCENDNINPYDYTNNTPIRDKIAISCM